MFILLSSHSSVSETGVNASDNVRIFWNSYVAVRLFLEVRLSTVSIISSSDMCW